MKIPDVNVLLSGRDTSAFSHLTARTWMERELSGTRAVGFATVALLGFVRIATLAGAYAAAITPSEAFDQVEEWLAQPPATIVHPGPRHPRDLGLAARA